MKVELLEIGQVNIFGRDVGEKEQPKKKNQQQHQSSVICLNQKVESRYPKWMKTF